MIGPIQRGFPFRAAGWRLGVTRVPVAAAWLSTCLLLGTSCTPEVGLPEDGGATAYGHGGRRFSQGWEPEWSNVQSAAQKGDLAALRRALAELKAVSLLLSKLAADSDLSRQDWAKFAHRTRVVALLCDKVRLHPEDHRKTDLLALEAAYVDAQRAWRKTLRAMHIDASTAGQNRSGMQQREAWPGNQPGQPLPKREVP